MRFHKIFTGHCREQAYNWDRYPPVPLANWAAKRRVGVSEGDETTMLSTQVLTHEDSVGKEADIIIGG